MQFKKLALASSLALASIYSVNSYALEGDYMNAQLAIADVDGFDEGLAVVGTYGVPLPQVHKNFSVEGEFTTTIADPDGVSGGNSIEASYFTLGAYAVYTHPINDTVKLRGRGGLLYYDLDVSRPSGSSTVRASDDGFDLSLGFGVTVTMTQQMNFIAEYTIIEDDITHLSAGVQYKF